MVASGSFYVIVLIVIIYVIYQKNKKKSPERCDSDEGLVYNNDDFGAYFGIGGYKCATCQPVGGSYVNSDGYCAKCDKNKYYNGTKCVSCATGQVLDKDEFVCLCDTKAGYYKNTNGQCVKCNSDQVYADGACTGCVGGKIVNNECICPVNFSFYKGTCVACTTTGGTALRNGDCLCPSGTSFGPSGCKA